ncbi:MAG: hypothetical protein M3067_15965 [Chloroflexota bacterium]|nr:hypothetical protein [Chloroflexota bacterium]
MGPALGFRFSRLTIAASLCVALVAAGCASAVPGSTKPQAETFVSDRYGFSVTLPTGSLTGHATVGWDASCLCGLGDPAWDHASVDSRTLVAGATAVDSATDLARWRARIVKLAPDICHDSEAATAVTIGGENALEWTASCSDGYNVIKLAALHGGRGYVVLFASSSSDGLADNQTAFDSLMSSFKYVGP